MTTDFHEMNLREQRTLNAALQAQIDHLTAALAYERQRAEDLAEALDDADTTLGTYIALFGDISDRSTSPIKGLHGMRHST